MAKHTLIFDSITEVPRWIEAHPVAALRASSKGNRPSRDWDDNLGFDGAMEMARKGGYWAKGAEAITQAKVKVDQIRSSGQTGDLDNDVAGFMPDIPAFLAGLPDSMLEEEEGESDRRPVISIGIQQYLPAGISAESLFNRGAAILSVVDELEAQGIRVEIWGCTFGRYKGGAEKFTIDMRTCLKRAEDQWSAASVAFGACHAGFSRRLGFHVVEAFEDAQTSGYLGAHFGMWRTKDQPDGKPFDIWFSYMDITSHQFETHRGALDRVTRIVNEGIEQMTEYKGDH